MTDLLWPGSHRAGDLMSDLTLVHAMVAVESAWLAALVEHQLVDPSASDDLADLVRADDVVDLAADAESGGNPVIPLLALLRRRVADRSPAAARSLHLGLTSQDVLDTALQLALGDVTDRLGRELSLQVAALTALVERHRGSVMAGRTLTQHAVPITFGLKASTWLHGLLDAADDLTRVAAGRSSQLGGAAGTLAATTLLAEKTGHADPPRVALEVAGSAARELGLAAGPPWHTARARVTRVGDALVGCTDAWGRVAGDVLTLSRPEIAELAEPLADGRGASSAMPQKANPILSVLIHRAALAAPGLGAQLHLAAAEAHDERPDGAWHIEWATLQVLARRTVVAAAEATELLSGLRVDSDRMRVNADAGADHLLAEGRSLTDGSAAVRRPGPADYLGATALLVDAALGRARTFLEVTR